MSIDYSKNIISITEKILFYSNSFLFFCSTWVFLERLFFQSLGIIRSVVQLPVSLGKKEFFVSNFNCFFFLIFLKTVCKWCRQNGTVTNIFIFIFLVTFKSTKHRQLRDWHRSGEKMEIWFQLRWQVGCIANDSSVYNLFKIAKFWF